MKVLYNVHLYNTNQLTFSFAVPADEFVLYWMNDHINDLSRFDWQVFIPKLLYRQWLENSSWIQHFDFCIILQEEAMRVNTPSHSLTIHQTNGSYFKLLPKLFLLLLKLLLFLRVHLVCLTCWAELSKAAVKERLNMHYVQKSHFYSAFNWSKVTSNNQNTCAYVLWKQISWFKGKYNFFMSLFWS